MLNEEWYCSSDIELKNQRRKIWDVCHKFNYSTNLDERLKILRNIFKKVEKAFLLLLILIVIMDIIFQLENIFIQNLTLFY